jgi:hypothetical protein
VFLQNGLAYWQAARYLRRGPETVVELSAEFDWLEPVRTARPHSSAGNCL